MPPTDQESAMEAISLLSNLSPEQAIAKVEIDRILACNDPHVDVQQLFSLYNTLYFRSLLLPRVELSWSKRLTLCAGMCELVKDNSAKYTHIRLKLSEPLLKFRPREDTINTLLHEAIHAYFFITTSWRHCRGEDGTGHGPGFLLLANAISHHGGYEINVFHAFHDEVDSYRTHVWQCDGSCRSQPPYFGLVKRTMNRPPGKGDLWWQRHQEECGGTYTKIMAPKPTRAQLQRMTVKERAGQQRTKIDSWLKPSMGSASSITEPGNLPEPAGCLPHCVASSVGPIRRTKRKLTPEGEDSVLVHKQPRLLCPICGVEVTEAIVNEHLDREHAI